MTKHDREGLTKNPGHKPNILVLADDASFARYHPASNLDAIVADLAEDADIRVEREYRQLVNREVPFANVDLIINYIDNWADLDSWEQDRLAARLIIWLAGGGVLLTLHNGIITRDSPELLQVHGADFTQHDPIASLRFELAEDCDPILAEAFEPFDLIDEPYEYRFDLFFDEYAKIWLYYLYQNERRPAAWHRSYGEGHMLYLMPGHDAQATGQPMLLQLVRNACRFLLHQQDDNK